MKNKKESLVLGLALFAMFFGAGNLIFPPSIGASVGDRWHMAILGFFTTGIGLPLLGIMAFNKIGSLDKFAEKISPKTETITIESQFSTWLSISSLKASSSDVSA